MKRLALYGAGGHGKVVADAALESGLWDDIVFFDEACASVRSSRWPVIGDFEVLLKQVKSFHGVVVSIGENATRKHFFLKLQEFGGVPFASVVHPSAVISRFASIDVGSVVFANSVINIDSVLGRGSIVNTGAVIDHECQIGEFAHISPGANLAGNTSVGDCSVVGIGACTKQGVVVGDNCFVGAGASVVSNIPDNVVVVGNPANRFL